MINLGPVSDYPDEGIYPVTLLEQPYLLIKHDNHYFCVEDKCGHFGISLAKGKVKDRKIICPQHYISFDLVSGDIVDHLGEDCEPIKTVQVVESDGTLYCQR